VKLTQIHIIINGLNSLGINFQSLKNSNLSIFFLTKSIKRRDFVVWID
jgi:hypothetical protein